MNSILKKHLIILGLVCTMNQVFCQSKADKISDSICRNNFLTQVISHNKYYSENVIMPVTIIGDPYRIILQSKYLHKYLTVLTAKNDSELTNENFYLDSITYLNRVISIINKKDSLVFNQNTFSMFVKNGSYILLDKPNPYLTEINKNGLKNFIKDRLVEYNKRSNETYYKLIWVSHEEYGKPNEYNLNYLIEALFKYNFIYQAGDGMDGFIRMGCD